jgi:CxxC-x17-CxxC domain-containing protein
MSEYKRKGPRRSQSRNNDSRNRDSNREDRRNASQDNRDSGRFDRRDSGDFKRIERTRVTCDSCHKQCEVPFKPSSNKPVYCNDCFRKESGSSNRHGSSRDSYGSNRDSRPRDSGNSDLLKDMNRKLDKIMKELDIE